TAFDADTGATLWVASYINPGMGITTVSSINIGGCKNVTPVGITGTPVIDATAGTMYFVSKIKIGKNASATFHQMLHAVDITSGQDRAGSPVDINATVSTPVGPISFVAQWELQRPALLLNDGVVYIGFGS